MKRIIAYALISILVLAIAFFPTNAELQALNTPAEEAKSEESFGEVVPASKEEPTEPSLQPKSEEPSTKQSEESLKPKESSKASSKASSQASENNNGEVRITDKVHKDIPTQNEDTSVATADTINEIRQQIINAKNYAGKYSNDCQNVAIMRANGEVSTAGAILASYGNSVSWYECSAYDYCAGFAKNEIEEVINKICQNLKTSSLSNYGIGIKISKEQSYYKIRAVVVFTS